MRKISRFDFLYFVLILSALFVSCKSSHFVKMPVSEMEDKVKGAWAGKMIGVMYGREMEFKAIGTMYTDSIPWTPQLVEKSLLEDDIYGQLNFMMTMERLGLDAPVDSLAASFANAKFPLCHANLQGRKNYFDGIKAADLALPENSFHSDDIDFQIESDFIGFINPAMPISANRLCKKVGSIMSYGDGMYGGMFVSSLHALAYQSKDIYWIINNALLSIPQKSTYAKCIMDVLTAYKEDSQNWQYAWKKIQDKWGEDDVCAPYHKFNIDAKLNGAYVVIGLLYGSGDLKKTMEITIRCGQDTDCNSANAAAVIGVMSGYNSISQELKSYIPEIADKNFLHTDYSYNKVVSQTISFVKENVLNNGGKVDNENYIIKAQKPVAPRLEQGYSNMKMAYQVQMNEKDKWRFEGNWKNFVYGDGDNDPYRVASKPGDAVEIDFTGEGVSLLGSWNVDGGKAKVYIDGKFIKEIDTYFREEAGKYDVNRAYLFHKIGLKPGKHTLRVIASENKNRASTGNKLYVERILVYKSLFN
ncbi:ADP-ribosylglycohydrolase family protein [Bacteroides sedimenti]